MKSLVIFLLKICLLATLLISGYILSIHKISNENVDFNYAKFTHKAGSITVGLSRANYAINPEIIENEFNTQINLPVLNFAFNRLQSQYGDVLLKSIKKKIDTNSNNGLFILSVNPGSFLIPNSIKNNFSDADKNSILNKVVNQNSSPNFEYFRKCYENPLYTGLYKPKSSNRFFHSNGWAENKSNYTNSSLTKELLKRRKKFIRNKQKVFLSKHSLSNYRIEKFKKTIEYLKNYGQVVIVRTPCDKEVIDLESDYFPNFNLLINEISNNFNVPYFNYTNATKYTTFDGAHLVSQSAIEFTKDLCQDIKNYQQQ